MNRTDRRAFILQTSACAIEGICAAQCLGSTRCTHRSQAPSIMAHYMPWFEAKPVSQRWGWHWTMNQMDPDKVENGRRPIAAHLYPSIGLYDSGDPHVLDFHLLTMKLAGIDGVIVDWYGLTDYRDYSLLHTNTTKVLQATERLGMKFAICYEDQTVSALVQSGRLSSQDRLLHASTEIGWLGDYWFKSPSYLKVEDKPVLLSFGLDGLSDDEWTECLKRSKTTAIYFSQQMKRTSAVGGFDWPIPSEGVVAIERFYKAAKGWKYAIPVVYPRFVDYYEQAKVGKSYGRIDDDQGERFRILLQSALDSQPPIVQLATWNDWGEGTSIEPSYEYGFRDLETTLAIVQERFPNKTPARPLDLQLPLKLFERMKKAQTAKQLEHLAQVIQNLANLDIEAARATLD